MNGASLSLRTGCGCAYCLRWEPRARRRLEEVPEPVVTIFDMAHERDARLHSTRTLDRRRLLERRETAALIQKVDALVMAERLPAWEVAEWIAAQADRLTA